VKLTAVLSVLNESVPLDDYSQDGLKGTRSVSAHPSDGTFYWTDLVVDKSNDMFLMNFVQFEEVPGFPRAPTITSASAFAIASGMAVKLNILVQPGGGVGGEPFVQQPRLSVLDKHFNVVAKFEVFKVTVRFTEGASKIGGILSKARMVDGFPVPDTSLSRFAVSSVNGIVQFEGLTIDLATTCYTLHFSAPGLEDVVSNSFDIRPGPVRQLLIRRHPAGAVPGKVLTTQPIVHLGDWGRNPVKYLRDRVQISLLPGNLTSNNTQPVKLYGTSLLRATDGIVEYTDLMIYQSGFGFRLEVTRFVGGATPVISEPIDIAPGHPYRLQLIQQPVGAVAGRFLEIQPRVDVEDSGGNRIETGSHIVTAQLFLAGVPSSAPLRGPECSAYQCGAQANGTDDGARLFCPTCVTTNVSAGRDLVTTVVSQKGICRFTALAIGSIGDGYSIRFASYLLLGTESTTPLSVAPGLPMRLQFEKAPAGYLLDTPFRVQPIIQLVDEGGNLVTSRTGLVSATLEHAQGSQLLPSSSTKVTMSVGRAHFVKLKIDKPGIGFTLLFTGSMCSSSNNDGASVPCLSARSLPFNVTGARTRVENMVQVETSVVHSPLTPQPQVHLLDEQNRTVNWDSGRLVITVQLDPASNTKNATLSGTLRVPCCSGICAFTDLVINKALVGYRLHFSGPPLIRLSSPPFDVVGPRHLRVSQEPIGYISGEPLVVQPHVEVLDIYRRAISGYWLTIQAQIRANTGPAGGILQGTTSLFTNESTVVFTDLVLQGYGSSYILEFECHWFEPVASKPFDVDFAGRPNVCGGSGGSACSAP